MNGKPQYDQELRAIGLGERRADLFRGSLEVACRCEREQHGELLRIAAEFPRRCALVAQARELHTGERMFDEGDVGRHGAGKVES